MCAVLVTVGVTLKGQALHRQLGILSQSPFVSDASSACERAGAVNCASCWGCQTPGLGRASLPPRDGCGEGVRLIEEAHFVQLPGGNEHHFIPPSIVACEAVIHTDFFHFTVQTTATGKGMVRFQSGLDAKQW